VKEYETIFVMHPQVDDAGIEKQIEEIRSVVTGGRGEVTGVYKWGRRKLAYTIGKVRDGFYTLMRFRADADALRELDRRYRLNEMILRHLTVASSGDPTAPDHRGRDRHVERGRGRIGDRPGDRGHGGSEPGEKDAEHGPEEEAAGAPPRPPAGIEAAGDPIAEGEAESSSR
jgi:small subunit ribosomal protein S6